MWIKRAVAAALLVFIAMLLFFAAVAFWGR